MDTRGRGWVALWVALGVLAAVLWCMVVVDLASAADYAPPPESPTEPALGEAFPSCQDPAGEYEGEDGTVAELRLVREDNRLTCLALGGRLDLLRERVFWGLLETLQNGQKISTTNEKLTTIVETLGEILTAQKSLCTAEAPCHVTTGETLSVSDSGSSAGLGEIRMAAQENREASEVATEVGNRDMYIVIGCLVGLAALAMLWRAIHG